MMEHTPDADLLVEVRSPYWFRITVTSAEARTWLEREIPAVGVLERSTQQEGVYNLFIDAAHDPQDVARYLASMGQVQQERTA